MQEVVYFICVR